MKMEKVLLLMLVVLFVSCSKDDDNNNTPQPTVKEYNLYIDFWNPNGNDPQIQFDAQNSSKEVRIDFSQTFAGVAVPPNFTNVIIDNVRIIDEGRAKIRLALRSRYANGLSVLLHALNVDNRAGAPCNLLTVWGN